MYKTCTKHTSRSINTPVQNGKRKNSADFIVFESGRAMGTLSRLDSTQLVTLQKMFRTPVPVELSRVGQWGQPFTVTKNGATILRYAYVQKWGKGISRTSQKLYSLFSLTVCSLYSLHIGPHRLNVYHSGTWPVQRSCIHTTSGHYT